MAPFLLVSCSNKSETSIAVSVNGQGRKNNNNNIEQRHFLVSQPLRFINYDTINY